MFFDDGIRDREAEAGALADVLRREERIEDARLDVFGHARAVVAHLEDDRVAIDVVPRAQDQRAASVRANHRLLGIDDQVQQHLLHLVRVGEDERQSGRERFDTSTLVRRCSYDAQRERLAHDLIEVDHRARRVSLSRERQQVPDDLRRALGLAENRLEPAARLVVDRPLRQPLRPGEDVGERVVQLVRHAGDRLAERRELFRLRSWW